MITWSKWSKLKDKHRPSGYRIRRYHTNAAGKIVWESYPTKNYADIMPDKIDILLTQLNSSVISKINAAKERYKFDNAFINSKVQELYEEELQSQMERPGVVANMSWLRKYVFTYFVLEQKIADPSEWHKLSAQWGKWLQGTHKNSKGKTYKLSFKTITLVTQSANKFLTFLNDKNIYHHLGAIRLLKPFSKGKAKTLRAQHLKPMDEGYISPELFKQICEENSDNRILPNFKLAMWYGLRIAETLGLERESFRVAYLFVNAQGIACINGKIKTGPLKTRDTRKIPHWFAKATEARDVWASIQPMHPDTLNEEINLMLAPYKMQSHDCRRSWITDAIDAHGIYAVQLAAGHKDIRTTMKYQRDKRNLDDQILD